MLHSVSTHWWPPPASWMPEPALTALCATGTEGRQPGRRLEEEDRWLLMRCETRATHAGLDNASGKTAAPSAGSVNRLLPLRALGTALAT